MISIDTLQYHIVLDVPTIDNEAWLCTTCSKPSALRCLDFAGTFEAKRAGKLCVHA
jgi:hypothetical protein